MDEQQNGQQEAQPNKFMPPQPGPYNPNPSPTHQQQIHHQAEDQHAMPQVHHGPHDHFDQSGPLEVDERIKAKRKQAKVFMILGGISAVLFFIGLFVLITSLGSSGSESEVSGDIEQILKDDTNELGLAIINYNSGREAFEITPEQTAELRVSFLASEFNDPRTNEPYILTTSIPQVGEMQYIIGGICNADDSISQSGEDKNFAIRVLLDEQDQLYCRERSEVEQSQL